jgi:hypothetical protein
MHLFGVGPCPTAPAARRRTAGSRLGSGRDHRCPAVREQQRERIRQAEREQIEPRTKAYHAGIALTHAHGVVEGGEYALENAIIAVCVKGTGTEADVEQARAELAAARDELHACQVVVDYLS